MPEAVAGLARAFVVLAAGFAMAESAAGQAASDAVSSGLAALALPFLQILDHGILRSGTELRSLSGWAMRVSEVCDGHGLAVSLAAGLAAFAPSLKQGLWRLAAGLLVIQVFNLARIIVLGLTLSRFPDAFDAVHSGVFPLLTVAVLAVCALPRPLPFLALALPLAVLWLPVADLVSRALVPVTNLILAHLAGPEVGRIAERAAGWTIGTNLLASSEGDQVRRFLAPLRPADFALGLPLVVAAVALSRRPLWLLAALVSMLAALGLAAVSTVWTLAAAHAPATVLIADGGGATLAESFTPDATRHALVNLMQNVLVHLNLLVLPLLVAQRPRHG